MKFIEKPAGVLANYHTHTTWCDGKDTMRAMVEAAVAKGFAEIGFSSHSEAPRATPGTLDPRRHGEYAAEVRALAVEYAGKIRVRLGVEADYIPGATAPDRGAYAEMAPEYIIGSVHYVAGEGGRLTCVDDSPERLAREIGEAFGGDVRKFAEAYYAQQREMALKYDFDVVGHPDLLRKFNARHPYFDEGAGWHLAAMEETAEAFAESGKLVEVNTGAISRGWLEDAYPGAEFRRMLRERGVRFILSADAHSAEGIDCAFGRFGGEEKYYMPA